MNNVVNIRPISKTYKRKFGKKEKWFLLFKKSFDISKIEKSILCDGIKVLKILDKIGKIKDPKLKKFIADGNIGKFVSSRNKEEFLKQYLANLDSRFPKLQKNNSFNTLRWVKSKNKDISEFTSIKPNKLNFKRSIKSSKTIVIQQEKLDIKYGKKIWVSVGINNYKNWDKLKNAETDATKITRFAEDLNFETINIVNNYATKDNIEKMFKDNLFRNLSNNDLLVFSFHGHGTTITINNRDHGFIVPVEASKNPSPYELISIEEFTNWIRFLKCKHVLLLFDCCFSGFAVQRGAYPKHINNNLKNNKSRIPEKIIPDRPKKTRRFSNFTIQKILSQKNRIAITAGSSDQLVSDGGWENNSAFTGLIISYPGFNTGIGSIMELYTYLLINVPKYSNQTPCIGKLIGDEGGDIFLSL